MDVLLEESRVLGGTLKGVGAGCSRQAGAPPMAHFANEWVLHFANTLDRTTLECQRPLPGPHSQRSRLSLESART